MSLKMNKHTFSISESATADLNNISAVPGGGSCTAAAFLKVRIERIRFGFVGTC